MSKTELKEWWYWKLQRMIAEYLHNPNKACEMRINFFMDSYQYFLDATRAK
ncbi:MAG: hypothetical protein AB1810_04430 [Pseudomonadota bacterium]